MQFKMFSSAPDLHLPDASSILPSPWVVKPEMALDILWRENGSLLRTTEQVQEEMEREMAEGA